MSAGLQHLPATATSAEVAAAIDADGACVVDHLVDPALLDEVRDELAPFLDATPLGPDDFSGRATRRTGALVARSQTSRQLLQHPLVLGAVDEVLEDSTSFHVHLTQVIAIGPGQGAQPLHRDQWAFDFFPFPTGFDVQCNTIWAMTDFTEENGATRVVPGSHRWEDKQRLSLEDSVPAEMAKGSVLVYTGSVYHGGGENRTDQVRMGVNLTYARSWLRQEENQYLSVPLEVAKTLDTDLLRLLGYQRGAYALGYVDDLRDPIEVVRPEAASIGFGDTPMDEAEQQQVGADGA
jgi:ectoine hydroxylase-related dioxygenase (phytanoyl-CoA dioxygenase family)